MNHHIKNMATWMGELPYTDMRNLAIQVIMAQDGYTRMAEAIPVSEIDKMARSIVLALSVWEEIANAA